MIRKTDPVNSDVTDLNPAFIGSDTDDWLEEEGFAREVREAAVKELLSEQLLFLMAERKISKTEFAKTIHTSRSQLDRILDPHDDGVTLGTLSRVAAAFGMTLRLEFVPESQKAVPFR